jgi:hypothetical protein
LAAEQAEADKSLSYDEEMTSSQFMLLPGTVKGLTPTVASEGNDPTRGPWTIYKLKDGRQVIVYKNS